MAHLPPDDSPTPDGTLTGTQLELMEAVWAAGAAGITVADLWQALSTRRPVARTTVLTTVQRLEKRGWLRRSGIGRTAQYLATLDRSAAAGRLAAGFVDEFFAGSATALVSSLLGSRRLRKSELARLRKLLDEEEPTPPRTRRKEQG